MKSKNFLKYLGAVLIVGSVGFTSCNNEEPVLPTDNDVSVSVDESSLEITFEEVEDLAITGIIESYSMGGRIEGDGRFTCAILTKDSVENAVVVTIDFGTGCAGPDGRVRKGVITVFHSGKPWEYGAVFTITLSNFSIDGIQIEGTRTSTNKTVSASAGIIHEIVITGGKVTWPDATFATREATRTRTWIRSMNNPMNDVVELTGSANGTTRDGKTYEMQIQEKLVFKRSCLVNKIFVPVSGIKNITTSRASITIDFGDGTCDTLGKITVNGVSRDVDFSK